MKKTSYERVIGQVSEVEKDRILKSREERFDDQVFKELEGKEREKTPEELQIIDFANKITNEIRQKYGLDDFDIPSKNFHIIKENEWWDKKGVAFYQPNLQGVAICEDQSKMNFAKKIIHEMLHFKSYGALQITKSGKPELEDYRLGLIINTRNGKNEYFSSLNEAVTEEITKKYSIEHIKDLSRNPLFEQEIKQTREIISGHPNTKTESGRPLFNNDIFYAEIKEVSNDKKTTTIVTKGFTYKRERLVLNKLIDKLLGKNKEELKDREEIFNLFAKGMLNGNILPIGRLIDNTFGKGTFRKIGELDSDIKAQEEFVGSL